MREPLTYDQALQAYRDAQRIHATERDTRRGGSRARIAAARWRWVDAWDELHAAAQREHRPMPDGHDRPPL